MSNIEPKTSSSIKCLMIGQSGIGKSTFMNSFPNVQLLTKDDSQSNTKGSYSIATLNEKFEPINIEIDKYDIALDTCLRDNELIINNKIIPSNKIITTCNYKVILLCFAMDDFNSFQLVKSKWEIEFKKNKSKKHSFVLIGLKSDTVSRKKEKMPLDNDNETNRNLNALNSETIGKEVKFSYKRSFSTNSNSSTSKLDHSKSKRHHLESESDTNPFAMPPKGFFKRFAKSIGSPFIQFSNKMDDLSLSSSSSYNKKSIKLNAYEKLINFVIKSSTDNKKNSLPKSISAPIDFNSLIKLKTKSKTQFNLNNSIINEADNETFNDNSVLPNENQNTIVEIKTDRPDVPDRLILDSKQNLENTKTEDGQFSVKTKLSRLFIGIGTYMVTCGGTNKSRRLAELKFVKNHNNNSNNFQRTTANRSFKIKKGKQWLLLSSQTSLNSSNENENESSNISAN